MQVREAMAAQVLVVGPEHTLRQAAQLMSARGVGSAVVVDPESSG
ncbi:MAG TPA: CBS domain-containing protein, partial [Micromonosporaceae bacterium]|nr:CBS domain-containing protein [Micromonosporaceae bacterium]